MKKHSINKISNDLCQFLIVFNKSTIYEMISAVKMDDGFDMVDLGNQTIKEYIDNNEIIRSLFGKMIYMQLQTVTPYKFSLDNMGEVEILNENEDDVTVIFTQPILDDSVKLIYPKMSEVEVHERELTNEDIEEAIDDILENNGFVDKVYVNECPFSDCDIYLNIKGKDVLIADVLDKEQLFFYAMSKSFEENVKVGESVKVKNKVLKKGNIIYTISKLEKHIPSKFTDEIVLELNYNNCKTVNEFKEIYRKNLNKVNSFYDIVNAIKERMIEINDIHISKECLNYYRNILNKFKGQELSDESLIGILKEYRMAQYINNEMREKKNIDTFLLDGIVKVQYQIDKLSNEDEIGTYSEYYERYENDLKLYMYVKKQ